MYTYGLVYDSILYGMIAFLVKFSLLVDFLTLMFAIYLVNKDYYYTAR